jgi:hypothetical protein
MITQYEVPRYLEQQLPVFSCQLQLAALKMNIYQELQHFTDYTKQAILQHNYALVKRCFRLADKLYMQGDSVVKSAIENTFIFSFSSFMSRDNVEKLILKSLIPERLFTLYLKQIGKSGC